MGLPTLNTLNVTIHFPGRRETLTVQAKDIIAMQFLPIPTIAVRQPGGQVRRYVGFPLETLDEESSIVAAPSPL